MVGFWRLSQSSFFRYPVTQTRRCRRRQIGQPEHIISDHHLVAFMRAPGVSHSLSHTSELKGLLLSSDLAAPVTSNTAALNTTLPEVDMSGVKCSSFVYFLGHFFVCLFPLIKQVFSFGPDRIGPVSKGSRTSNSSVILSYRAHLKGIWNGFLAATIASVCCNREALRRSYPRKRFPATHGLWSTVE